MRLILGKGKVSNIIKKDDDIVLSKSECNITLMRHVKNYFNTYTPSVVINCAAKTNLEYCQENKIEAFDSNTYGVLNLIQQCKKNNTKLVHISSGCLFDGNDKISTEASVPSPGVWYTWTKNWADEIIKNYGYDNYLILRPRQLISKTPHKSNMITKFLGFDEIGTISELQSVTCIEDFSKMIDHLIDNDKTGIFNCCNTGTVSPHDIAIAIRDHIKPSLDVSKISYDELLDKLPNRRVNTILSCKKLIQTGYTPRSAQEALLWCVKNYDK